jgi:hypothetical protein
LFESVPAIEVFTIGKMLCLVSIALIVVGEFVVPASVALTVILTLAYSIHWSFGKISHNYLNILMPTLLCVGLSLRADTSLRIWVINLATLAYLFSMFAAGMPKLLDPGWLGCDRTMVADQVAMRLHTKSPLQELLGPIASRVFWEAMDWGAVLFEVAGPTLVVLNRRLLLPFLLCAMGFHIANGLVLDIHHVGLLHFYTFYTLVCLQCLQGDLFQRLGRVTVTRLVKWSAAGIVIVIGFWHDTRVGTAIFTPLHLCFALVFLLTLLKRHKEGSTSR